MAISAIVTLNIDANEEITSPGLTFTINTSSQFDPGFAEGTGLNEVELAFSDTQTASSSSTATLTVLSLYDERGTVAFSAVKLIYFKNRGPGTAVVGGTLPYSGSGDELILSPGAIALTCEPSADGYPIDTSSTALSTITVRADEDSETCAVDIILLGEGSVTP
jgi:hypothetical protein